MATSTLYIELFQDNWVNGILYVDIYSVHFFFLITMDVKNNVSKKKLFRLLAYSKCWKLLNMRGLQKQYLCYSFNWKNFY